MNHQLLFMRIIIDLCVQALYTQSSTTATRESTRPEENTGEEEEEDIPLEEACVVCQVSSEMFSITSSLLVLFAHSLWCNHMSEVEVQNAKYTVSL